MEQSNDNINESTYEVTFRFPSRKVMNQFMIEYDVWRDYLDRKAEKKEQKRMRQLRFI